MTNQCAECCSYDVRFDSHLFNSRLVFECFFDLVLAAHFFCVATAHLYKHARTLRLASLLETKHVFVRGLGFGFRVDGLGFDFELRTWRVRFKV